jgi:G2/mitotic-specific cyclin 2
MQRELAWNMRGILVDFIIQLHTRFRMQQETLFLTVNVIDRFLSIRECSVTKFQLVGCAAFFIASKCEETIAPSYQHLVQASEGAFTDQELLNAERYILRTLNWDLSYPNPLNFLRRASKADDYDVHNRTLGKFLIEIGVVEWRLVACPPSLLAAAAMWIARLILGHDEWVRNRYRSSYCLPFLDADPGALHYLQ